MPAYSPYRVRKILLLPRFPSHLRWSQHSEFGESGVFQQPVSADVEIDPNDPCPDRSWPSASGSPTRRCGCHRSCASLVLWRGYVVGVSQHGSGPAARTRQNTLPAFPVPPALCGFSETTRARSSDKVQWVEDDTDHIAFNGISFSVR